MEKNKAKIVRLIEIFLFSSRWLLIPFYVVLFFSLMIYMFVDIKEFFHYLHHIKTLNKEMAMLIFVEMIDITMIANLGKMIITGSYNSFVSKDHEYKNENINSGFLKVKIATSLIGVSSIALLQKSINITTTTWDELYKLGFIYGLFLLGAIALELVDYWHSKDQDYSH